MWLKQSTAKTVYVGPVLDSAGAAVTTAVQADFRLVKNGTPAVLSGATVAHDANGYYTIALSATNTNTIGHLDIGVGNSAMSMSTHRFLVLNPTTYDILIELTADDPGGLLDIALLGGQVVTAPGTVTFPALVASETTVSSRASQTSVDGKPTLVQIEASAVLAKEATVGNRPTLTQIESSTVLAKEATVGTRASQTSVDGKPTLTQIEASTVIAKENTVNAVGTVSSATLSGVNTLLSRITTGVGSMFQDLIAMITGTGTASAKWSANALSLAPTGGGGGGTGTGARTVTITVTLSGAPVEGARVRLTKAAESYISTTNASGQITFNIDDGSWIVGITSPNTTFAGAVLAVSGTVSQSYSLTAMAITPSAPGGVTGYWTCLSQLGLPESGVTISMQACSFAEHASTGLALDTTVRTTTSDANGLAQFADLVPGVRYQAWRGTGLKVYVTIPAGAESSLELNSLLGNP